MRFPAIGRDNICLIADHVVEIFGAASEDCIRSLIEGCERGITSTPCSPGVPTTPKGVSTATCLLPTTRGLSDNPLPLHYVKLLSCSNQLFTVYWVNLGSDGWTHSQEMMFHPMGRGGEYLGDSEYLWEGGLQMMQRPQPWMVCGVATAKDPGGTFTSVAGCIEEETAANTVQQVTSGTANTKGPEGTLPYRLAVPMKKPRLRPCYRWDAGLSPSKTRGYFYPGS